LVTTITKVQIVKRHRRLC